MLSSQSYSPAHAITVIVGVSGIFLGTVVVGCWLLIVVEPDLGETNVRQSSKIKRVSF